MMRTRRAGIVAGLSLFGLAPLALAGTPKVLKHDKYDDDITTAVAAINGQLLQTEPGFVQGEAFGVVFRPETADYPLTIDGVDMVFAAPPNGTTETTQLALEFYLDSGPGPAPKNPTPDFTINTSEFYYNGDFGVPIKGGQAYSFNLDPSDPNGAPPPLTQGNVMVMVRFLKQGTDMVSEWGTEGCLQFYVAPGLEACGCQPAGMILDGTPTTKNLTPNSNVMHLVWPLGTCSGNKEWKFFDTLSLGTKKLNGDVILRLRVSSSDSGCQGDCTGKECGDDGCGASCGQCADGLLCDGSQKCVAPCVPACDGKVCGENGCGGKCGNCAAGLTCTPEGKCQQPCNPNCTNRECGPDGCGGTCGSGPCTAGTLCDTTQGLCIAQCTPSCDNKACGSDGCGGQCGQCGDNEICTNSYTCEPVSGGTDGTDGTDGSATDGTDAVDGTDGLDGTDGTPVAALSISAISPDEGTVGTTTQVSITGAGFTEGLIVKLGGTSLENVTVLAAGLASGTVPKTLAAGLYDLILLDKSGKTATLPRAFDQRDAGGSAAGCTAGPTANYSMTGTLLVIAFVFVGSLAVRLRRSPKTAPIRRAQQKRR